MAATSSDRVDSVITTHLRFPPHEEQDMARRSSSPPQSMITVTPFMPVQLVPLVQDGKRVRSASVVAGRSINVSLGAKRSRYLKQACRLEEYVLECKLAESSEGEIFVYRGERSGREFVVKHTWHPVQSDTLDCLTPHRNIINVYGTYQDAENPGRYRLIMERCACDLFQQLEFWYVRKRSSVPEVFVLHFIVEMMDALAFLHHSIRRTHSGEYTMEFHHAIIHADFKPENIFLRWREKPQGGLPGLVLGDFGAARRVFETWSTVGPGTLAYHAPEDKAIYGDATPSTDTAELFKQVVMQRKTASDMYAFGQILFQMLAKERNPMPIGADPDGIRISSQYETPGLRELLVKCLAVDPAQRAEASFDEDVGILTLVGELRKARDSLMQSRWPLDRTEWVAPPPPVRRI